MAPAPPRCPLRKSGRARPGFLTRVYHPSGEQTDTRLAVLDAEQERMVHANFNGLRLCKRRTSLCQGRLDRSSGHRHDSSIQACSRQTPDAILAFMPALELYDHQSALPLDMERLFRAASEALPLVIENPGPHATLLPDLAEVEVSFISDETISTAHAQFMDDPSPTDVITFQHGEILISTDTAIRQAAAHDNDPQRECALYLIHGLLHLHGHDDHLPDESAAMKRLQESILDTVWPS